MSRPVAVMGLDSDDQKHILVVVALNPFDAYASKDGKHAGFIRGGQIVRHEKDAQLTENETKLVLRCFFALRAALSNMYEVNFEDPYGFTKTE